MPIVGYPYRPVVVERANCGPTVLATLLGKSTISKCQRLSGASGFERMMAEGNL